MNEKVTPFKVWLARQKGVAFKVDTGDGKAEKCDVLVCRKFTVDEGLIFQDNRIGKCENCGCAVQFRPHAPTKPKRLCYSCVPDLDKGGEVMITPKTAAELATLLAKGRKH